MPSGVGDGSAIDLDAVGRIAAAHGITAGYAILPPSGADGVYTVAKRGPPPEGRRLLHIDRYSGVVLQDVPFSAYGGVARLIEWGVALHTGEAFGRLNQAVLTLGLLAIIGLVLTGVWMWWKRRPSDGLGVPGGGEGHLPPPFIAVLAVAGVLLPLFGASLLLLIGGKIALRSTARS